MKRHGPDREAAQRHDDQDERAQGNAQANEKPPHAVHPCRALERVSTTLPLREGRNLRAKASRFRGGAAEVPLIANARSVDLRSWTLRLPHPKICFANFDPPSGGGW